MGLGGILILLLLLVSLIVFIYVLVVSARGWGWLHSILLSFLFIECWVLLIFAAGVHYRRVNATREADKQRTAAASATEQTQKLLWGGFNTSTSPDTVEAVVPAQGMLRRMTADRGRVWRRLNLLQSPPGSYQLEMSAAASPAADAEADPLGEDPAVAAAAPAAAAVSSESLPAGTVVYGFAEQVNEAGQPIPVFYLGEFSVKQSQAGQVTLEPTMELSPAQQQHIAGGSAASWTLYELLPLDSHDVFAASDSTPSDDQVFGAANEELLRAALAAVPNDNGQQQQLVDSYLRDGKQATEVDRPEDVWVLVNVLKEYTQDVDSEETAIATERGFFDASGRSIDSRLKRGENGVVSLTADMKGKRIVLKEEVARPLINSGVLELVHRVYVRPLIDYEEAFVHHMVREQEVLQATELARRDQSELEKANQVGQEMLSFREQVEAPALRSDMENYQREVTVLQKAIADATTELTTVQNEIRRLYQSIQAQHAAKVSSSLGTVSLGN